jgi:hypothetical protein
MTDRDPWDWREGQHWHQHTTNGDRYGCPAPGCWWTATGLQAMGGPPRSELSSGERYGPSFDPDGPGYEALTRDAGGEVWPSDDRGLSPRTCTCEPGQLDLTGRHHEACPALDDR